MSCVGGIDCDCGSDWEEIAVVPESALREAEEREAKLREALERIIRLPCAHPDDPDEHKKMALDLVKAQEIAHAAIGDRRGR